MRVNTGYTKKTQGRYGIPSLYWTIFKIWTWCPSINNGVQNYIFFLEYHYEYTCFYMSNMYFNQCLALVSFLFLDFVMKKFKHNLEAFYSEPLCTHLLDCTINILVYLLCRIYLSVYPLLIH